MKTRHSSKKKGAPLRERVYWLMLGVILTTSLIAGVAMINLDRKDGYGGRFGARSLLSEDPLIGERVVDRSGETLGAINDVVIDTLEGRLVFALISPDGYTGSGDEVVPVPWGAMVRNDQTREFVLKTTPEGLKMAPRFQKDKSPELDDPCWDGDYQRFDDVPIPENLAGGPNIP